MKTSLAFRYTVVAVLGIGFGAISMLVLVDKELTEIFNQTEVIIKTKC